LAEIWDVAPDAWSLVLLMYKRSFFNLFFFPFLLFFDLEPELVPLLVPPEDPEPVDSKDGFAVGFIDGDAVGAAVNVVGAAVGGFDGADVGAAVGGFDGAAVGAVVGDFDGAAVGAVVGGFDGAAAVGAVVGALLRHVSGREASVMFAQVEFVLQQSFMPPEIVLALAAPRQALYALHAFLMPPI